VGDKINNDMSGECSMHGRQNRGIQGMVRKPEEKTPLGRPRHIMGG